MSKEVKPMSYQLLIKMKSELGDLLAQEADKEKLPLSEWVVKLIAKRFERPDLGEVPRISFGRPRAKRPVAS